MHTAQRHLMIAAFALMLAACGGGGGSSSGSGSSTSSSGSSSGSTSSSTSSSSGSSSTSSSSGSTSSSSSGSGSSSGAAQTTGWLYTKAGGNKIYLNSGAGETVWVGRGVNVDDLFLGGYNYTLWMATADAEAALTNTLSNLISQWHPTLLRLSLNMSSWSAKHVSWLANPAEYRQPMERVINKIGDSAGVYVMVTLRSDESMSVCNASDDATCFPEAATNAVYRALVDSFANKPHVMFGVSNEPGGNVKTPAELRQAMSAAVDAIRTRERELGVPEHIVVVQGDDWTSTIDFYSAQPLTQTNVVYEYHSYPPAANGYTFSNIPVIIGEYGSLTQSTADALYRDVEGKQISTLAWYFSPYSAVWPPLLDVTHDASKINPNSWGTIVRNYLANPGQYQ
jgi:hypothetical protein